MGDQGAVSRAVLLGEFERIKHHVNLSNVCVLNYVQIVNLYYIITVPMKVRARLHQASAFIQSQHYDGARDIAPIEKNGEGTSCPGPVWEEGVPHQRSGLEGREGESGTLTR